MYNYYQYKVYIYEFHRPAQQGKLEL